MFQRLDKSFEFSSPSDIKRVQEDLLQKHVMYLARRSPFYQRVFKEAGREPSDIRKVEDLFGLPFTTKEDLENHGADFLCVDPKEVVDICLTSGTTGCPVAMLQTKNDLDRVGYNEEISFRAAGIGSRDTALIAAAIDRCFMAGLAYFFGLTNIGATVIRAGSSSVPVLMDLITSHRPNILVGVPTLLLTIGDRLRDSGTDPAGLGVEKMVCIGEPVRNQDFTLSVLGERLAACYGGKVFGTYASTEMATAFSDCEQGRGGHLHPELMVIEVVDESGNTVPSGKPGEIVATPLQVTGMPLLRFKTGDIAVLHEEPCGCGRNSLRLGPLLGRKSQMLKYKGTTVYPPAIFSVLQEIQSVKGYFMEVYDKFELSDHIKIVVGCDDSGLSPALIAEKIAARVRVKPEVEMVSPQEVAAKTIRSGKRKPITFFDYRRK